MDYADTTLVVLAEELGSNLVFTADRRARPPVTTGTYDLNFRAGDDPALHSAAFAVR